MKRIAAMVIVGMLWMGNVSAATWEPLGYKEYTIDTSSIKVMQVDYNEIAKASIKYPTPNGGHAMNTWMINMDSKEYCRLIVEYYDSNGSLEYRFTSNPKNPNEWSNDNQAIVTAMLNRVP